MKYEFFIYIKSRNFLIVFIVLTILSVIQSVDSIYYTKIIDFYGDVQPAYISILCNNNNIKYTCILFWLMPIYLIFSYCSKYNIERKSGVNNIILTKKTKKKNFFDKMAISFINPFILVGIPVIINLLINVSFLHGNNGFMDLEYYDRELLNDFFYTCMHHPYATYLLYMLSFLVVCGILGCVCESICMITKDNKISYILCLTLWMIYFTSSTFTVAEAIQPLVFEYTLKGALLSYVYFALPALLIIILAYIITIFKKDEI